MKKTREKESDFLKYFLLILAIILLICLIVITLKVYQRPGGNTSGDDIEILTEAGTEKLTEAPSEKITESETESEEETESESESETATEAESETAGQTAGAMNGQAAAQPEDVSGDAGPEAQPELQAEDGQSAEAGQEQVQAEAPEESTGDYRTIISACNLRSYPDYGDNIIGECYAGQTVEFLGEEAGWYKISADGTVGYIGPKFLG